MRELSNVIERLVVFSDEGAIHMEDLPTDILAMMPKMKHWTLRGVSSRDRAPPSA